ncbi:MAG: cupin domain-containing protein [Lachnospiraceae bacterium]
MKNNDYGPDLYVANVKQLAVHNCNFRTAVWAGGHMQMTVMQIPPCGEVGMEIHEDTDQIIRVECGTAMLQVQSCSCEGNKEWYLYTGDTAFIPMGTWHNIVNVGSCPLRLSSIYAPPHHPRGTVHRTKKDAEK